MHTNGCRRKTLFIRSFFKGILSCLVILQATGCLRTGSWFEIINLLINLKSHLFNCSFTYFLPIFSTTVDWNPCKICSYHVSTLCTWDIFPLARFDQNRHVQPTQLIMSIFVSSKLKFYFTLINLSIAISDVVTFLPHRPLEAILVEIIRHERDSELLSTSVPVLPLTLLSCCRYLERTYACNCFTLIYSRNRVSMRESGISIFT